MEDKKSQKMTLESFKKKKKPKNKSKLFDFKSEILNLYDDNYSLLSICEFLQDNGVKTTFQNLSKYIKKIKNSTYNSSELADTKKEDLKIEEKKTNTSLNEMKQLKEEKPKETEPKKSLLKTSNVKKFEIIEPDYSKFIH